MSGDEVRARRAFHVALDDFPGFRDFRAVTIDVGGLDHALVKFRADVGRLKIHNVHAGIAELELDRHGKRCEGRFRGVVSRHKRRWKSGSQRSDVNDQTFTTCLHVAQCELYQLDLAENQNLKLARNRFRREKLSSVKMTGPSVVDHNVEVTSFFERGIECLLDGKSISKVETHWMASRHFGDAFQVA